MIYLHQACYIFVFGYCVFGPGITQMPFAGSILLCSAAALYLALDLRFEWRQIRIVVTAGVIAAYCALLAIFVHLAAQHNTVFMKEATAYYAAFGVNTAAFCLGSALYEEVIFRRHLVRQLQRFMTLNKAIVVSSIAFMLCHGSMMPSLFLGGLCYCLVTYQLQSFHAAVVIHALHNFFGNASLFMDAAPAELNSRLLMHATAAMTFFSFMTALLCMLGVRALVRRSPVKA